MRIGLVLIFLAFPLLELAVLIKVGQAIGFWWTMLILVATAIGGGLIVHAQGFAALRRMTESMEHGRVPIEPVVDSVFLMLAGALMLTPGLITDAIGGLLLIPQVRRGIASRALRYVLRNAAVHVETRTFGDREEDPRSPPPGSGRAPPGQGGVVIEGEWEEVKDGRPRPESGRPRDPGGRG